MKITTKKQEFVDASILEVEVGTTGLCGGDSGNGGRTYLRLKENGGGDMRLVAGEDDVQIILGGDAELRNLIAGLRFALDVLTESNTDGTLPNVPTLGELDLN